MGERISGQTYSERSDGWKKYWKVEDLWEVAEGLPIEYIPLQLLTDQLEGTYWTQGEEEDVTPQWVLGHTRRILKADLNYPILVNSENTIVDGIHRLCRAVLDGRDDIAVQRIEELPPPLFKVEDSTPTLVF